MSSHGRLSIWAVNIRIVTEERQLKILMEEHAIWHFWKKNSKFFVNVNVIPSFKTNMFSISFQSCIFLINEVGVHVSMLHQKIWTSFSPFCYIERSFILKLMPIANKATTHLNNIINLNYCGWHSNVQFLTLYYSRSRVMSMLTDIINKLLNFNCEIWI